MSITYEKYTSITGTDFIRRINDDGSFSDIPTELGNLDYQMYLLWLENADEDKHNL